MMKGMTMILTGKLPRAVAALALMLAAGQAQGRQAQAPAADLANAPSPYLRQHADNLVAWRTWGKAAFDEARKSNKPIFLSIGYMACHWCHVMEETNFMNPEVAAFINAHFIPILVDRERRPDVDETYMLATEALTGRGGWPNNLFLTPHLQPFFAHGHVPASRMLKIARAVARQWQRDAAGIRAEAGRISTLLANYLARRHPAPMPKPEALRKLARELAGRFDPFHGGLGTGPKFFRQPVLMLLARVALMDGDEQAREALVNTLTQIARGGVMDQLAGGFHRYAVDGQWNLPHFEKMLYTQALMSAAFMQGWRITGNGLYARTARRTLAYVLDDLRADEGGFHSARDADSEGAEGAYYVWSKAQLHTVLGARDAGFALSVFGTVPYGELAGKIIPSLQEAKAQDLARLEPILEKLARARKKRIAPRRDEKIITAWNGLMIASLADGARLFGEEAFGQAAADAADFIWHNLRAPDGSLRRAWYDGAAHLPAMLDDYAFLARGMIALYDLSGEDTWLDRARELVDAAISRFADEAAGDFWYAPGANGYARAKLARDGDLPSAQAVMLTVLGRLARRTGKADYRIRAGKLARALSGRAHGNPAEGAATLRAVDELLRGEDGAVQYAAGGIVRAQARRKGNRLLVRLRLKPGWHVNAHEPANSDLVPTRLTLAGPQGARLAAVRYPRPKRLAARFSEKPLLLLDGDFTMSAQITGAADGPIVARLTLQACSMEICLQPQTMLLRPDMGAHR